MSDFNVTYLNLIAAKAKQLAEDLENGKLWDGELATGIKDIAEQLSKVRS